MEIRAKAELTQQEYEHEVLAEFGTEEMGVFNKDDLDFAQRQLFYTYEPLNKLQERALEGKQHPLFMIYDKKHRAPQSLIRTAGIDWDAIITLYKINHKEFLS